MIPVKEDAPLWAATLARYGINCVRLQFLDLSMPSNLTAKITSLRSLKSGEFTSNAIFWSFAFIADGIESLSDVISSTVVYFGLRVSIKPPDYDHPYGHGKAEPVAAIIVSRALIAAAIVIGAESIVRIQTPRRLPEAYTLWVLLAVVGIKALLSRYVSSVGEGIDSTAVRSDAWHHLMRCHHFGLCVCRYLDRFVDQKCRG